MTRCSIWSCKGRCCIYCSVLEKKVSNCYFTAKRVQSRTLFWFKSSMCQTSSIEFGQFAIRASPTVASERRHFPKASWEIVDMKRICEIHTFYTVTDCIELTCSIGLCKCTLDDYYVHNRIIPLSIDHMNSFIELFSTWNLTVNSMGPMMKLWSCRLFSHDENWGNRWRRTYCKLPEFKIRVLQLYKRIIHLKN